MVTPIAGFVGIDSETEYVPNPYFAHVDFWIGEPTDPNAIPLTSYDQTTPFNFTLVSFRYTREVADLANHFEVVLYDPGFVEIETILHRAPNLVCFQYYYVIPSNSGGYPAINKASPVYSAVIAEWDPALTMAGTVLTIQGVGWLNTGNVSKRYIWSRALTNKDVQDSLTRFRDSAEHGFLTPHLTIDTTQFEELEGQDEIPVTTQEPTSTTASDGGSLAQSPATNSEAEGSSASTDFFAENADSVAGLDAPFSVFPDDVQDPSDPNIEAFEEQQALLEGRGNDLGILDDRDGYRISDIALLIASGALDSQKVRQAQGKPWIPDVEPTKPVLEHNGVKTTAPKNKVFSQAGRTDVEFLHELAKDAISVDGKSGYRVWTTDAVDTAGARRTVLHFRPPDFSKPPIRVFTFMYGDPASEVLNFSASVKLELLAAAEGGESQFTYQDAISGNIEVFTANKETDILSNSYAYLEGVVASLNSVAQIFGLNFDTSGLEKAIQDLSSTVISSNYLIEDTSAINRAFYQWYQNYLQFITADMTIMGDPVLDPLEIIEVWVMLPPSTNLPVQSVRGRETEGLHPVSGKFLIQRIVDEISGGTFTSRLELSRMDMIPGTFGGSVYTGSSSSLGNNIGGGSSPAVAERSKERRPARAKINTASSNASVRVPASSRNRAQPEVEGVYPLPIDSECVTSPFNKSRTVTVKTEDGKTVTRTRPHKGCDLRAAIGTPVSSPVSGKVTRVAYDAGGYGNWVEVEEAGTGNRFRFAHLDSTVVRQGQRVAPGKFLGYSGDTGGVNGPHLHLEVRINGVAEDPAKYFSLPPRCGSGGTDA